MLPSLHKLAPTGLAAKCPALVVPDADDYENNVLNGLALPLSHAVNLLHGTETSMPMPLKKLSIFMDALDAALVPPTQAALSRSSYKEREVKKQEINAALVALNRGLGFLEVTGKVGLCVANQFFDNAKVASASDDLLTMIGLIEDLAVQRGDEMTALEARIIAFFAAYGEAVPNLFPLAEHITTKSELLGLLFITAHRLKEALQTLREVKAFVEYALQASLAKEPAIELPEDEVAEQEARADEEISLVRRMINWLITKPEETEEDKRLRELEDELQAARREEEATEARVDAETQAFAHFMEEAVRQAMAETWGTTDAAAARAVSVQALLSAQPTAAQLYSARAHGGEALRQSARAAAVGRCRGGA
jgi:hypothetical protein